MIEVIPAVLSQNYEDMKNKIALVRGIVPVVQIDLCDGVFVKNKTWPFATGGADDIYFQRIMNEEQGMPFWEDIDFELDLMVSDAISNFDIYTKLSPKRIVFHVEAISDLNEFKNFLEGIDVYIRDTIEIGIAINVDTEINEQILSLVNYVDFVQTMGIAKIGFQGQNFDKRVFGQIKKLKEKYPDLIISVDGGVSLDTAQELVNVGVERLVAGSAILKSIDIREAVSELENIM